MYQHDLRKLISLDAALWVSLQVDMTNNPQRGTNWDTVKDWDNEKRYDVVDEAEAKALYDATANVASGVMQWIRRRW